MDNIFYLMVKSSKCLPKKIRATIYRLIECVLLSLCFVFSVPLPKNVSLFTSTTWSWSAGHINLSMKATSTCLTRSWSLYGRHLTTAIVVATSPPLWSSKMVTQENQSSSEQCLILKGLFHLEQQLHISCKSVKSRQGNCCCLVHRYRLGGRHQHRWAPKNIALYI